MPVDLVAYKDYKGNRVVTTAAKLLEVARDDLAFPYPAPFLDSMLNPEQRPAHNPRSVSVTHVIKGCLSCKVLMAYEPYTLDLDAGLRAWRGTQFHALMERHQSPKDIVEVRFMAKVPGTDYTVHGKPDLFRIHKAREGQTYREATLVDLKTTQSVPTWDQPWGDHVEQAMDYTWLIRHSYENSLDLAGALPGTDVLPSELVFKTVVIWYMSDKNGDTVFKPLRVQRKVNVATGKGAKYPTRTQKETYIWTDEEIEALLVPKVTATCDAFLEYEDTKRLPPYPKGFDPLGSFEHRYSPVAAKCLEAHVRSGDWP